MDKINKAFRAEVKFLSGAADEAGFPSHSGQEVALIGRSNVGKSSLINALFDRKALARVSHTPGRTRQLNFFQLTGEPIVVVDLPGYGYSRVSKSEAANWQRLIVNYLVHRKQLNIIFMLIDARRGLMESDIKVANLFTEYGIHFRIILTKIDKLNKTQLTKATEGLVTKIKTLPSCYPEVLAVSSHAKSGIEEVRKAILGKEK